MPELVTPSHLDLVAAAQRLRGLHARARQAALLAVALAAAGGVLSVLGQSASGIPFLIGAAGALALVGLSHGDRRRLLVALVAQGDAWSVDGVAALAEWLQSPRERRRIAEGLRAAADVGQGAQLFMMVHPPRADAFRERLETLADRFSNPLVGVSAQATAICRRLLSDAQNSPLYNPLLPEEDLRRILDVVDRKLTSPD